MGEAEPLLGGGRLCVCATVVAGVSEMGGSAIMLQKWWGTSGILFFWIDPWVGGIVLSVWFSRLYDLSVNKNRTVEEMFEKGWGEGGGASEWRRRLWDWEEMLVEECRLLLANVVLQVNYIDQWRWSRDPAGSYTVRSAYDLLTSEGSNMLTEVSDLIWHRQVPLKVSILAWCLFRTQLPTKPNLVTRGMLGPDAQMCVAYCGEVETTQHLFLSCPIFSRLWHLVRAWIGVSGVDLADVSDHFVQFINLLGGASTKRSFMQLLWLLCV